MELVENAMIHAASALPSWQEKVIPGPHDDQYFRHLIERAHEIIMVFSREGRFLYQSPSVERILGYKPSDLIGRDAFEFIHPDDLAILAEDFKTSLGAPRQAGLIEFRVRHRDGHWRILESTSVNLLDDPRVRGVVANSRDITDRKQAEIELRRQKDRAEMHLRRTQALHNIDLAITGSQDLTIIFKILLGELTDQLAVDAADILLLKQPSNSLEYAAGRGFGSDAIQRIRRRLGEGFAGRAALERRIVEIPDLSQVGSLFGRDELLAVESFVAYYGVPLIAKGRVYGVLEVFHRTPLDRDEEWLAFLEALAGQAAIAIENATLFADRQRTNDELFLAYETTLEGWSAALDLRDKETEGHTQRVTEFTLRLAREMGFDDGELVQMRRGALLHDIGKMGVPDSVLLKPGKLDADEWEIMRRHPTYAFELLHPIVYLRPALDIPYCHHEKWDGTGYPRGLKGEEIPLPARVFAIVDVWDALRSDRPYRRAWPEEKVLEHIRSLTGSHFDPRVVEAFLRVVAGVP